MAEQVEFHTGVQDMLGFACRLLRKAQRQGAALVCTAPAPMLDALDKALWAFEEREFVPHVRWPSAAPALLQRTSIWLSLLPAEGAQPAWGERIVLNLGAALRPEWVPALGRLIEVVGTEEGAATRGRERWRAYKAAGLTVLHHGPGVGKTEPAGG
jgi:DNA polymerase III subunit chi